MCSSILLLCKINVAILANPGVINHGLYINFCKNASLKCTKSHFSLWPSSTFMKWRSVSFFSVAPFLLSLG